MFLIETYWFCLSLLSFCIIKCQSFCILKCQNYRYYNPSLVRGRFFFFVGGVYICTMKQEVPRQYKGRTNTTYITGQTAKQLTLWEQKKLSPFPSCVEIMKHIIDWNLLQQIPFICIKFYWKQTVVITAKEW